MSELTLPASSGIYKITCTVNKKIYIGSAVDLRKRKRQHFSALRQNRHCNQYLQRAWNKYGELSFIFEVIEFVLPMSLTAREQYWFGKLKPFGRRGYNIASKAGSTLGVKRTPEQIEKTRRHNLGRKQSPETIEKRRQTHLGSKRSPETRARMSQSQFGHEPNLYSIEKMRQANLGNHRPKSPETRAKISQSSLRRVFPKRERGIDGRFI